jgi:hypothetical protein
MLSDGPLPVTPDDGFAVHLQIRPNSRAASPVRAAPGAVSL